MLTICFLIHRLTSLIKPHSHCPGSTPVKTSQVYLDKPGSCFYQIDHVLTVTVRCYPGVAQVFYHGVVTVHAGVHRFYYGNSSVKHLRTSGISLTLSMRISIRRDLRRSSDVCTYHLRVTLLLRSRGVSVTYREGSTCNIIAEYVRTQYVFISLPSTL